MSEPTTEAGRKMWREVRSCLGYGTQHVTGPAILAIEAEARAAVLRELREVIDEHMKQVADLPDTSYWLGYSNGLGLVLDGIDRRLG